MTGWDTDDQDDTPTTRTERLQRVPPDWTPRRTRARKLTMAAAAVVAAGILLCVAGLAGALGNADPVPAAGQPRPLPTPAAVTVTGPTVYVTADPVTRTETVVGPARMVVQPTTIYVPTPSPSPTTVTATITETATITATVTITETYTPPAPEPTPEPTEESP